jgi:hypothetical protein
MDRPIDRNAQIDSNYGKSYHERDFEFRTTADAVGYWFAAAVLFAFLAAVIIVYRTAHGDLRVAANDTTVAAQSSAIELPALHVHVEGVDP